MGEFYCEICGAFISNNIMRVYYDTEEDLYKCDKCAKVVFVGLYGSKDEEE